MYSIIVPVFNSEKTLSVLKNEVVELFQKRNESFEIIFVDDCSKDNSWNVLRSIAVSENIKIFRLAKNYGQHSSTLCGIHKAKGDIIITIDDDLQYPTSEINKLIDSFKNSDKAILFGIPKLRNNNYIPNLIYKLAFYIVNRLFYKEYTGKKFSSFAIFKKRLFALESIYHSEMQYMDINHLWMIDARFIGNVEVSHIKRAFGKSNYSFIKVIKHIRFAAFNIIIKITNLLILIAGILLPFLFIIYLLQFSSYGFVQGYFRPSILLMCDVGFIVLFIILKYIFKEFLYKTYRTNYIIVDE